MRKIILALLVLLLASPAMATVTITVVDDGNDDGWVTISYVQDDAAAGKRPRGFGLDVTCTADANICDYDTNGCEPFPIYMGSIEIDSAGNVVNPGSPIAPGGSPGAAGALGDSAVTVEMGSLYDPLVSSNPNQPALSGDLLRLKVNKSCTMLITANTTRVSGGVVLEDGTTPGYLPAPGAGCAVTVVYGGPDWEEWHTVGDPVGWANPEQCHGNADNRGQGMGGVIRVSTWDLEVFAANYGETTLVSVLTSGGDTIPGIDADFAHDGQGIGGGLRVSTNDLAILAEYYGDSSGVPTDCQSCSPVSP